jgi:UDP-N-acetylmuramoyl-L-alanyl-D-glutamate--2,6-diaminopimelate ligase
MAKTIFELLDALPDADVIAVTGDGMIAAPVTESTDDLQPGGAFVARAGKSVDGHDFIAKAIEMGATAIFGSRPLEGLAVPYVQLRDPQAAIGLLAAAYYDFPSRSLVVIGVTGTDGKTTTSTMIHSIMKLATGGSTGYISTLAADIGGKELDTGLHVTTPGAPQVQAYLNEMVENGLSHVVLEMTSHGLAQGRLNGVDIDAAVVTNITHEHLDYHGSWQNYRDAKASMFQMLKRSANKYGVKVDPDFEPYAPEQTIPKIAIINADDAGAQTLMDIPADLRVTYGITSEDAQCRAEAITLNSDGASFRVGGAQFTLPLVGAFNVYNALAAIAVTRALGVNFQTIQAGLSAITGVSGRMQRIDEGQDFLAIVDFAHTPNALRVALEAARTMIEPGKRVISVFGCAGLRDVEKRRMMAETTAQLADISILTAEDPRTESLEAILEMMANGCRTYNGVEGETFFRVPDRGQALLHACQMAQPGDIVMACGKGHEQSMCFGTIEYPWDDRDALRAALKGQPLKTLPTA